MGRLKKRFNHKARQRSMQSIEELHKHSNKLERSVELAESDVYKSSKDESNVLVIDTKTLRSSKSEKPSGKNVKILSKKQRKNLTKIIEQKKKKEKRAELLESLQSCQVSKEELSLYSSTSKLGQAENMKRKASSSDNTQTTINTTSKRKRKRKLQKDQSKSNHDIKLITSENKEHSEDEDDEIDENDKEEGSSENEDVDEHEEDLQLKLKDEANKQFVDLQKKEFLSAHNGDANNNKAKLDCTVNMPDDQVSSIETKVYKKPVHVDIERSIEIQTARLMLPIIAEEQLVMETINENDVVVICGSTGSGKTTQVPQFLYEAGYGSCSPRGGMIGITEPRRVAAISMSKRVAEEMNLPLSKVSYQIRYEGNISDETSIKFMTDGVLLKEMEKDFLLTKYSAIVIDEAHERSVYTDILVGLLSRVVPMRKKKSTPLKLIIMSATLRVEDFTENKKLFPISPPILKIDSRQYPVTVHFNKQTHEDYVTEAYKKVCKIHRTFKQDGGVLVFLTGQNEVKALCRKLQQTFPAKPKTNNLSKPNRKNKSSTIKTVNLDSYHVHDAESHLKDKEYIEMMEDDNLDCEEEEVTLQHDNDFETSAMDDALPLHVLPLYSMLSSEKQAKVFSPPPDECRLCVVATNVAETSLTIPGIKYIIDSGKVKQRFYDKVTGISTFRITWTSQASADQRTGRAGRVGPGHCYRLYSSAVFQNDFMKFSQPEICRRPVEDLLLQMKSMCIDNVVNFPFPSAPDITALKVGEKLLVHLGALKNQKTKSANELAVITPLGKQMSSIPVSPRFSKMITLATKQKGCLAYVIAIVSALTVQEIFTDDIDLSKQPDLQKEDFSKRRKLLTIARRKWTGDGPSASLGDLMVVLRAVGACEYAECAEDFCRENGLRLKAMMEIRKLRKQLSNTVQSLKHVNPAELETRMRPPTNEQALSIRKLVLSCFADRIAKKLNADEARSLNVKNAYRCCSLDDPVYIHPTSSMFAKLPEYIVYHEMVETSRLYMKTVVNIEEDWLPHLASHMCHFSKPLEELASVYDHKQGVVMCHMSCTYGPHVWRLPAQLLSHPPTIDKYRWFARFLLEGRVAKQLHAFSEFLLTPASVMVKSWSHLQPKTTLLLNRLLEKEVDCRERLNKAWKKDPRYLLSEYLEWVIEKKHEEVKQQWPPQK